MFGFPIHAHDKSVGRKINAICDKSSCVKNFILLYISIHFFFNTFGSLSSFPSFGHTGNGRSGSRWPLQIYYCTFSLLLCTVDSSETHSVDPFLDQSEFQGQCTSAWGARATPHLVEERGRPDNQKSFFPLFLV